MGNLASATMPSPASPTFAQSVELATARANRYAASRTLVWTAFTLLYVIPTVLLSRIKLFWDDEFFTLYLSRTADWKTLLQALATGADQHPPSFYYLTHGILGLFGTSPVTLRLTAIAGFWLLCICLYEIIKPLTNPMWAVVAMLLPLTTPLYYYAMEARAYGLVVGFIALAALSWFRVSAFHRRGVYLPLLALSLAGAVASHYYASMAVVCLALGELVRTGTRRRIDWPIWVAFAFAALPILLFFQTIQSAKGYSTHFWAVPIWSDAIYFYPAELGSGPIVVLGALGVVLCFRISLGTQKKAWKGVDRKAPLNLWQVTATCALSALPVLVMTIAKSVTHGFADRYAISAIVGVSVLLSYLLYRVMPHPRAAVAASAICIAMFGFQVHKFRDTFQDHRDSMAGDIRNLSETRDQPVAMMGITVFHRLSFYAPRQLASRLAYLSDPDTSIQYIGHDTIDRGLLDLDPWFPINVIPMRSFLEANREFLAYGNTNHWSWLTFELPKWGQTKLLGRREHECLLFSVTDVHPPPGADVPPQLRWTSSSMLYTKMPQTGPSLCERYMGAKNCP